MPATLVVCLMLTGGEALEDYAEARAGSELTSLLEGAPTVAYRMESGDVTPIPVEDVEIGDRLLVRPHDTIPVDCRLSSATAVIDESSLTGESLPVEHVEGDSLLSGSLNGNAAIEVVATADASASQYQRIIELVQEAQDSKAPFVRLADRVAVPFTLIALVIAGAAWMIAGDPMRFAQVLVVATPCPLIIAAPVAFMAGMSRAARGGMIVKNAGTIEQVSKVRTVAFDKTGTLTRGVLEVSAVHCFAGHTEQEMLRLAASAELHSSHPLGEAIVATARRDGDVPVPSSAQEVPAQGVSAVVGGAHVRVGKRAFVADDSGGVDTGPEPDAGYTVIWIGIDGILVGRVDLSDPIRPETRATLTAVHQAGVPTTAMLTGDAEDTANRVAAAIGIDDVRAGLLPEDKVNAVSTMPNRPVMMVGDGVNDAPVLAVADVGVAMGARGSTAAVESADVVIMLDDFARIPRLLLLGQRTMKIAWQAILIGVIFSVVLMLIGATGVMPAFVGAWMQELVDLACILWALLAARPSRQEKELIAMSQAERPRVEVGVAIS
ncbi:heavy metal translocating P-type ATPase [Flaviflexus salsibiostraticola]|nr:heavy metal translocating P-type ATPase [Flaviflexus salsibiostraticola]